MKKILVILLACLSVSGIVSAASSATTEVQIAIEGTESAMADVGNKKMTEKMKSVQTGDKSSVMGYLSAAGLAIGLSALCMWKKKKKSFVAIVALFLSMFLMNNAVYASNGTENVSVTVPSNISVTFDESGENSVSEFGISNQSLVPITVEKVNVIECNDWNLCGMGEKIDVNTKKMAFSFEGQCLKAEDNMLDITIDENSSKNCDINVERGAWTTSGKLETALQLDFEYSIGKKQFQLSFDTNGSGQVIETQKVYNGDSVELPCIERVGYKFIGWEDPNGNLHTEQFVMPIGDIKLTAKWKETKAYAIFIEEDNSLRFISSAEPITVGSTYDGKIVKSVYTGFEKAIYNTESQVPWYDDNYYMTTVVKKVIVEDAIQPVSTAHWFHWMYDCENFELSKLDMSKVTNMSYMFAWAGFSTKNFQINGLSDFNISNVKSLSYTFAYSGRDSKQFVIDLSNWDVSKVTDMSSMFAGTGYFSTVFGLGDLSRWNVSNVTDMSSMFRQTGYNASWYLNCSGWNVDKVWNHANFSLDVSGKIKEPKWVN